VALTLIRTLKMLAAEKKAIMQRQSALVASLNRLLPTIGYRVVPVGPEAATRARSRLTPRATKPLTCPKCQRMFALPLHLGRHLSVMHKGKRRSTDAPTSAATPASAVKSPRAVKAIARRRRRSRPKPVKKGKG
jgi:hypothetical protein